MFTWVDVCSTQPLCRGIQSASTPPPSSSPSWTISYNPENNGVDQIVTRPVHDTVGRPTVRPSVPLTAAATGDRRPAGGFAAERRRLQQISINICGRRAAGAGAQQQMRVVSCSQPTTKHTCCERINA